MNSICLLSVNESGNGKQSKFIKGWMKDGFIYEISLPRCLWKVCKSHGFTHIFRWSSSVALILIFIKRRDLLRKQSETFAYMHSTGHSFCFNGLFLFPLCLVKNYLELHISSCILHLIVVCNSNNPAKWYPVAKFPHFHPHLTTYFTTQ